MNNNLICVAVSNKLVLVDFKQQYYHSIETAFIIKLSGMLYVHNTCCVHYDAVLIFTRLFACFASKTS
jgi:hypothetical protein